MGNKFHCTECAGHAKAKEETCSLCDGEGNKIIKKKQIFDYERMAKESQ